MKKTAPKTAGKKNSTQKKQHPKKTALKKTAPKTAGKKIALKKTALEKNSTQNSRQKKWHSKKTAPNKNSTHKKIATNAVLIQVLSKQVLIYIYIYIYLRSNPAPCFGVQDFLEILSCILFRVQDRKGAGFFMLQDFLGCRIFWGAGLFRVQDFLETLSDK